MGGPESFTAVPNDSEKLAEVVAAAQERVNGDYYTADRLTAELQAVKRQEDSIDAGETQGKTEDEINFEKQRLAAVRTVYEEAFERKRTRF